MAALRLTLGSLDVKWSDRQTSNYRGRDINTGERGARIYGQRREVVDRSKAMRFKTKFSEKQKGD